MKNTFQGMWEKRLINSSESRVFYWLISTCILKHYFFICCKEPRARPRTSRRGSRTRRQSDRVNLDDSENDVIEISESYQALPLPLSFEDAGLEISIYIYMYFFYESYLAHSIQCVQKMACSVTVVICCMINVQNKN